MKWKTYQDFCSALWDFCLRHCNFPLNTLTHTTRPNCYRPSCFLASQVFASHSHPSHPPLTACGGSSWIQIPAKTADVCTSPSLQAVVCPASTYQSVNALHSANTVCLARQIMCPGNHSSQPRLSSLLAQKILWWPPYLSQGQRVAQLKLKMTLLRLHEVLLKSHPLINPPNSHLTNLI